MAEGGQNAYRFSISWTRIIPDGTGEVCEEGVAFYDRLIDCCLTHGLTPLATLYHYDLPATLFEKGGWESRETVDAYERYAQVCFDRFGDRIKLWASINEPNYETQCCYAAGNYPPNVQDLGRRWHAMYNLMLASARAISRFRNGGYEGQIGVVSDSYSIETLVDDEAYRFARERAELFFDRCVNDTCILGEFCPDLVEVLTQEGYDLSYIMPEDAEVFAAGTVDYLGVNAYDRYLVKPYTQGETCFKASNTGKKGDKKQSLVKGWFEIDRDDSVPHNSWDMEIYPKSLYNLLKRLYALYPAVPFIITENGLGYKDVVEDGRIHDGYRIEFLQGFVDWMLRAKEEGCDVRGYFVWSTMDVYSWINGYDKRYGLVYVDYDDDCRRICKDSYYWYKEMIARQEEK